MNEFYRVGTICSNACQVLFPCCNKRSRISVKLQLAAPRSVIVGLHGALSKIWFDSILLAELTIVSKLRVFVINLH